MKKEKISSSKKEEILNLKSKPISKGNKDELKNNAIQDNKKEEEKSQRNFKPKDGGKVEFQDMTKSTIEGTVYTEATTPFQFTDRENMTNPALTSRNIKLETNETNEINMQHKRTISKTNVLNGIPEESLKYEFSSLIMKSPTKKLSIINVNQNPHKEILISPASKEIILSRSSLVGPNSSNQIIQPKNSIKNVSDFVPPDVGGSMEIRVISRFRPLNQTEKVK